jgi:homospermidine synthase
MVEKKRFDGKVLIIGYGAVSQCTLPLILKHFIIPIKNITIIDQEDKSKEITATKTGIKFRQIKVAPDNLDSVLSEFAGDNGLVVDLAYNIGANEIVKWCHDHNTLYVNTSVEAWDPEKVTDMMEKTLYHRQMLLRKMVKDWPKDSVTSVLDHGANPGLISHFTKKGLIDIANAILSNNLVQGTKKEQISRFISEGNFGRLAHALGVKVIHCSERDTQISKKAKEVDEFVNTWSIPGFWEEGFLSPSELGWGTHERKLPPNAHQHISGPKNQIALAQMGINTWHRSFVPTIGEILGMVIRHGEAFGISDRLTVRDGEGNLIYRPTVHYVYMPCHEALSSLAEFRAKGYELQPNLRIMTNEIECGKDILGALIMGHALKSWWTGTILDIEEARRLAPGQNATTLQVAAGVVSAMMWMIDNPRKGLCFPEDLPHEYILEIATPYLGELHSKSYDWTPLKNRKVYFPENPAHRIDTSDPWQFECFTPLP